MKNSIWDEWDKSRALKRGGDQPAIAFDDLAAKDRYGSEPLDPADPEKLFERSWALLLIDRVLARLEKEFTVSGKSERFEALHPFLLHEPEAGAYPRVAERLAMEHGRSEGCGASIARALPELVRLEIVETLSEGDDIEEELRHLMSVLSG